MNPGREYIRGLILSFLEEVSRTKDARRMTKEIRINSITIR